MLTISKIQKTPIRGRWLYFYETSQVNPWAETLANNVPFIESNAENFG